MDLARGMRFRGAMSGAMRTLADWVLEHTDPATTQAEPELPAEPVRDSKHTVLVIDDDPTFLHIATSLLRKHGFDVLMSTTGAKGLNMLCYGPGDIEVVLLDYSMPQLNGAETLGYVRKLNPNVKVIALTAVDPNQLPKSFRDGVDILLQKPFDARKVIDAIHSLLEPEAQPATLTSSQT
jgi:CheY-like chemotaxis protein